jgi:hypothetical protein
MDRCEWANGERWYYYPERITLSSIGPGTIPVAASFSITLDPQVVSDVRIVSARLNHKVHDAGVRLLSDTQTASNPLEHAGEAQVRLPARPGAGGEDSEADGRPTDRQTPDGRVDQHGQPHHAAADRPDLDVAKRFSVGIVPNYLFILPAVIVAGWILSWWRTRRVRWILLSAATLVSVLCVVIGWQAMGPPVDPRTISCSSALACFDPRPLYPVVAGLLGLACCVALLVLTLVGELIIWFRRRASA